VPSVRHDLDAAAGRGQVRISTVRQGASPFGVLGYMLGLSYRAVEMFLRALDCPCGKSSVDRGLLFLVDIGNQRLIGVEMVEETQADEVRRIVREVMAQVGATELRTDEHSSYEGIAPEGSHRLCLTHWLKSKGKRAWDLLQQAQQEQRPLEVSSLEDLLALLRKRPRSPTVPEELSKLVRRYLYARKGLPWRINQLLQHIERTWEKVSDDPIDPTNNVTERIIGLTFKIRAKTMRGFKTQAKVRAHPYLSFYLRGQDGLCDLREVV